MTKIKKQIKKLSEVERLRIRMDYKFSLVDEQFVEIREGLKKNNSKLDLVLNQLGSIVGQFKKFDDEQTMQSGRIAIHSDEIKEIQGVVFAS